MVLNRNGLEALSAELFSEVIRCLPVIQDRVMLSLVSKSLYEKAVPYIYKNWEFRGYDHSFKSLYLFLRTILEHPNLASLVLSVDIRDWNRKRSDLFADDGHAYYEEDESEEEEDEEEDDAEAREERARRAREKVARAREKAKKALMREEIKRQEALEEEQYDQYIQLFRRSTQSLLSPQLPGAFIDWFCNWINDRDSDILLARLVISLPNLKTLYMTIPEDQEGLLSTLAGLGDGALAGVLGSLNTIYVCSALHIGVKGHREYYLDLDRTLSLFKVQSLRSLSILTPMGFNAYDTTFNERVINPLSKTSNVTDLAFDEADAEPDSIISMLSIPKSLRSLRWTQGFSCFSIGSCKMPFYDTLSESLLHHRQTLEHLDLDLRHALCESKGHAGNPHARLDDMISKVREGWRAGCHLLGSLKEFLSLRSLKIPPEPLCGNKIQGTATLRLADSLPASLEDLTLPFQFSALQEKRNIQLGEQTWINELAHLARNSVRRFPRLRKITVLDYNPSIGWPTKEDKGIFRSVEVSCAEAGIEFVMLKETSEYQTPVFHFLEILPTRNPGRDY